MYENERYKFVYVDGKKVPEHVLVWERAHDPKPQGCDIHHIDGNGKNNALENLECLTKSEHRRLHAMLKLEGMDVIDSTDPAIIASRKRNNESTKAHRQAHLEEERAKDRAEYQRNKEQVRLKNKRFYRRHREEIRDAQAEYERQHTAERAKRNADYYAAHAEERKQYARDYNAAHKEAIAERRRAYTQANSERIKAYKQGYKAVHAAQEKLRRAIRKGSSEEDLDKIRAEIEQVKLEFQKKKETSGNDGNQA